MSDEEAIESLLQRAGVSASIVGGGDLSGGCIHRVRRLELGDGTSIVAKIGGDRDLPLFEEEALGLRALARTDTVLVPTPILVEKHQGRAFLLTNFIPSGSGGGGQWRSFGEELARLHQAPVGARYGFEIDNHLGRTPQPNRWNEDWVQFNRGERLGHQLALARTAGLLHGEEVRRIDRLIEGLDRVLPCHPRPSLLHGDLWSGNALPTVDAQNLARVAVIDPAPSIGDGWADIAMMKLFGGFPAATYEAYASLAEDREEVERRIAVYQLYHLLNHVNLFGRSYAGQMMQLVGGLGW